MLVVNSVKLKLLQKRHEIMRFRYENAVFFQHPDDELCNFINIIHVGKYVCCCDNLGFSMLLEYCRDGFLVKEGNNSRYTFCYCELPYLFRSYAEHPVGFEIAKQIAVVGADINYQVIFSQIDYCPALPVKLSKIFP